jgi:TetR/AcrR family transcriptional regulator, transcriptional repressor for nem operon
MQNLTRGEHKTMTQGEKTRQRIIREAAALLNQYGFSGFSMSELMKATGLEKGGIYRHFDSKEQLAAEAFDYAWQAAINTRMRDLDSIASSVAWLKQFVDNFVNRRPSVPGGCPLLNLAIDADDGNPALRQLALRALRRWQGDLVDVVKRGIARKEIKGGVGAKEVADTVISSLEGALMISRLEGNKHALFGIQSCLNSYFESHLQRPR